MLHLVPKLGKSLVKSHIEARIIFETFLSNHVIGLFQPVDLRRWRLLFMFWVICVLFVSMQRVGQLANLRESQISVLGTVCVCSIQMLNIDRISLRSWPLNSPCKNKTLSPHKSVCYIINVAAYLRALSPRVPGQSRHSEFSLKERERRTEMLKFNCVTRDLGRW